VLIPPDTSGCEVYTYIGFAFETDGASQEEFDVNKTEERMSELARLVTARLEDISFTKSQREVADDVGFVNRNMLSLIKNGDTKLSLDRVPAMAKSLGLDLEVVMLPALRQYYTEDVISLLRETFGSTETQTEHEILSIARKNMDTRTRLSFETRAALAKVFSENKPMGS
jgi:transcriptional regulator with XRE-family HTH domain